MAIVETYLENLTLDQLSELRIQLSNQRASLKAEFVAGHLPAEFYSAQKQDLRRTQLVIAQLIEQKQVEGQKLVAQAEEVVGLVVRPDSISSAERFNG